MSVLALHFEPELLTISPSPVGVGGLLLGGGLSYFGSYHGWAVDNIVNYEVVTADSKILQVNAQSYSDLFFALKGGASNFGLVTRFYLKTYPRSEVYAGFIGQDSNHADALEQAVADFVDPKSGGSLDPRAVIDASFFYDAETGVTSALTSLFFNGSTNNATPAAFGKFTQIPATSSTLSSRTFQNWLNETLVFGKSESR